MSTRERFGVMQSTKTGGEGLVPDASKFMPSSVKVADFTVPDILSWAMTCLDLKETRGKWPLAPRKAMRGCSGDADTAKCSRLFSSLLVRCDIRSTLEEARSIT